MPIDYVGTIQRANLVDLATKAGSIMHQVCGEWRGNCPLHNGEDKNAFAVYRDKTGHQKWKCFSHECGQGDALDFVQEWLGYDKQTAFEYLEGDKKISPQELVELKTRQAIQAKKMLDEAIAFTQKAMEELISARAWERYHDNLENDEYRELWRLRGIPDVWQDIWQLGYCPEFRFGTKQGYLTTPTLSIPIFDTGEYPVNIRHRLLNPLTPNDKYRPEKAGLKATPFICDPELHFTADKILVCEGEVKSMVAYITLDDPSIQVIGLPGKSFHSDLVKKLKGHRVVVCLDPDAQEEANQLAKDCGGKVLQLRGKIDDIILEDGLGKQSLRNMLQDAKKPY